MAFHFNKTELRQLYRRFEHLSTRRLINLFNRTEEEFDPAIIKRITEFYHQYQINSKSPGRFKFNIRDTDLEFNTEIIINIIYFKNKPVFYIINSAIVF